MHVVGVSLIKVYKAMLRLESGALSIPLLMSLSEALSVPFYTLIKLCYTKALEWSSLVPGPRAKSFSSEIMNLTPFTINYQRVRMRMCPGIIPVIQRQCYMLCLFSKPSSHHDSLLDSWVCAKTFRWMEPGCIEQQGLWRDRWGGRWRWSWQGIC